MTGRHRAPEPPEETVRRRLRGDWRVLLAEARSEADQAAAGWFR